MVGYYVGRVHEAEARGAETGYYVRTGAVDAGVRIRL